MAPVHVELPDQPGWTPVSAGPVHVLLRGGGALADRVRGAASTGGLDDVLDELTREGLRATPDFVAVEDGEAVRVVARGRAYAVLTGPHGDVELRAPARGPWSDADAPPGTTAVSLRTGEEAAAASVPPPQDAATQDAGPAGGSEPAPLKGWRMPAILAREAPPAPPAPPAASAPPPVAPAPAVPSPSAPAPASAGPAADAEDVDELPSYDHLFGSTQHERPTYIEQHDTAGIVEPPLGSAPIESAGGFDPGEDSGPSQHTLAPPAHTVQPPPATPPAEGPPAAPRRGSLIDSVPWRSGGSNVPAPDPAPRTPRASTPRPGGTLTPPPAPSLRPTPPPVLTPPPVPAPPPPPAAPPAAPPVAAPAAPAEPDDAEATVDRSTLLGGRGPAEGGPVVLAVLCPAGHTSPPHSGACRLCGRDIPPQQPFPTPRPPLGVLTLATGDVVQLDRGVLLGRSPKVNAELAAAERPHLVRVASPQNDISRNHVEIVLEGWHVLIRDLGSTNGTTIALPGQPPVRLRPSDQQVLEPGTVITLADEVSLTYEVSS